jgi:uncharacterized membrane protein
MGSAVVPPVTMEAMSRNMVWDGLFHLATWTITVVGVFFLWDVGRRGTLAPTSALLPFVGQLLIGWGAFNLVEGLVDHHVLGLHHIRDLPVHVPLKQQLGNRRTSADTTSGQHRREVDRCAAAASAR